MHTLFDDISRLAAEPRSWWQMLGGIFSLLMGAVLGGEKPDRSKRRSAHNELEQHTARAAPIGDTTPLRAYADLARQERDASAQVVSLHRHLSSMEDYEFSADARRALITRERELFLAELPINEKLQSLYKATTKTEDHMDNDPLTIRTALLHWTILLRRRSMQSFHTVVEGLEDDASCGGDIIADQLLLKYFDTLFEETQSTAREALAVRALTDLARQSACLGAQQSALLASDLYWSFIELRGFLRLNGIERVLPYVSQAAAAPMLLFYDVEKYRGPQAPLGRWFAETSEWLIQGAETKRIPLVWHGLWLYDRRSGRLFGYRPTAKPAYENEVHLALFLASIISRENLGRYDCSFTEMIERGATTFGYLCAGSVCSDAKQSIRDGAFGSPTSSHVTPQSVGSVIGGLSGAGFSEDSIKETLCRQSSNGTDGSGGDGGRKCGDGVAGLGRNWAADVVQCLSEKIMQPGEKLMRCTAEALGLCSSPLETAVKNLQQSSFVGIPLGKNCQISAGKGTSVQTAWDQYNKDVDRARDVEETLVEAARAELTENINFLKDAQTKRDDVFKDPHATAAERDKAQADVKAREEGVNKAAANLEQVKKDEAAARDAAIKTAEEERKKKEAQATGGSGSSSTQTRCPPDTPNCGGNDCTGMSTAAIQTLRCFEIAAREEELKEFESHPGVVDPNPEDMEYSGFGECFESFGNDISAVHKQCWAYDCGPQATTGMTAGGKCGCGPEITGEPGPKLNGMCAHILCSEGNPTIRNGMCTCGGGPDFTGGTFGTLPIPKGPFITSSPRLFSEVHLGNMPPTGSNLAPRNGPSMRSGDDSFLWIGP
jgi:hypothetical protein